MTTRTTMAMTSLIMSGCMWGGKGGMTSWVRSPFSSPHSTTWEAANLMISLSCAPRLLFLVNFHESRACNSLSCIVFDPFTHSLFCPVPPVPWQCWPCSLCPWWHHELSPHCSACCLGGVRAAADICRYLDSIPPLPPNFNPPSPLLPAGASLSSWCVWQGRVVADRPTSYYSVTRQLLRGEGPHTLSPLLHLFIFSPVSHLPRQPPPFSSCLHRLQPP